MITEPTVPVAWIGDLGPEVVHSGPPSRLVTAVLGVDLDGNAQTVTVGRAAWDAGVVPMLRELANGGSWDIFRASHAACERLGINEFERARQAARDAAVYEAGLAADGRLSTAEVDALADGTATVTPGRGVELAREVRHLREIALYDGGPW